jgi:cell division protease FtsH
MNDVDQRLPRRVSTARKFFTSWKFLIPAAAALVLATALAVVVAMPNRAEPQTLSWTQMLSELNAGRITSLEIASERGIVRGELANAGGGFVTNFPAGLEAQIVERAEARNVAVSVRAKRNVELYRNLALILLQVTLFGALGYYVYLQMRGQSGDVGRTGESTTTFGDVGGTQGAAEDLQEIVAFLKDPTAFAKLGARVPKGVLLAGPPGTGKTLLARAVAGEAGVPFFQLSGSEVTGFVVGLGAQRIRKLFARARKHGGVIFIDELDSLGAARGRNRSHNEDDRTLNQLLVEMDGFAPTDGVIVVGATNRPEDLDPALQRPGRFDRHVTVGLPTTDGRAEILRLHAERRRVPVAGDVDFDRLARLTPGASGAELANLLNEAAIFAVKTQSESVQWRHFESARDRMLLGKERVGFRAPDREWQIVAFHEAGHAVAGVVACPDDGLHKVTIQPRGRAMGVAHFAPDDDRHLHPKSYLEAQIIKALGGRVAEELVFGAEHITGGAESDLVHANRIARRMVYRLGMSGSLLVHDEANGPLSGDAQARMDADVQALLANMYERTREILTTHRASLDALAHALLERETLDGAEAMALLEEHGVTQFHHA